MFKGHREGRGWGLLYETARKSRRLAQESSLFAERLVKLAQSQQRLCASREGNAMHAVLLVTWFYFGQSPTSSQIDFSTMETCEVAKEGALADGRRLKADAERDVQEKAKHGIMLILLSRLSQRYALAAEAHHP